MTDQHDLNELTEMILLGLREQAIHPQGLNSSQTHGTRFPLGDPRNKQPSLNEPVTGSSKLMLIRAGSR